MRDSEDWDKVLNRLTENTRPPRGVTVAAIITTLLGLSFFTGILAIGLMLLNTFINSAWPELQTFRPGIGYRQSFGVCGVLLIMFLIKTGIIAAISKGDQR